MSKNENKETKTAAAQPKQPASPDGKSELPIALTDFPAPGGGDSGPSTGPMPK